MGIAAARGVVRAEDARHALDLLTEIATPLHVRLDLEGPALALTTHGEEPWWATVTVPLAAPAAESATATVARLDLRQAVDAEALLVPEATCAITVVTDDVVRYGAFALVAADPSVPEPPVLAGPGTTVGTWELAGGRYRDRDGRVLVAPASSVDRFVARGIEDIELVDADPRPFLVGRERGVGASELVLVARGEWAR